MTDDDLDAFVAAAARMLALRIDPLWLPAVRSNLKETLKLASAVAEFALPDDAEPAPVFWA